MAMLLLVATLALFAKDVSVPADSPRIVKIGRFDTPTPSTARCEWSGAAVEMRVRGSELKVQILDQGDNYLSVDVDGQPSSVLHLLPGTNVYTVSLPSGDHELRLVKRTEAFVGPVTFQSFTVTGNGEFLGPRAPKRLIEFVGDSITCGYGNEGKSEREHFSPATENADMSYAWIAARKLNAEASIIAWSGRKMWPDNTTPSIYDLIIPTDPASKYDFFSHRKPEVVVINLATNDFGRGNPDKAKWCAAYEAFISRLRLLYPDAEIYCSIGSMMSDNYPPNQHALTTVREYIADIVAHEHSNGDHRVKALEFAMQKQTDGLGADYHPSIRTDEIMADRLVEQIRSDLGW